MKKLRVKPEFIGKKVLCVKPCIMKGGKNALTTMGEYYEIVDIDKIENKIIVINDEGRKHYFSFKDRFFKISALLREEKIKNL